MVGESAVGFIKIDVEGMELEVLAGFEKTIASQRPPIFIEVEHVNRTKLESWLDNQGYGIDVEGRRFRDNQNLLLVSS